MGAFPRLRLLVLVALAGMGSGVLVSHVVEGARGGAPVASEASPAVEGGDVVGAPHRPRPPGTWVVRRGESLWSIAGRLAPDMDRRRAVDLLVEANGGAVIHEGEVVDVSPLEGDG